MTRTRFDVTGIGNAIVDIVSAVDDQTIGRLGMTKGAIMLVDENRSSYLRAYMQPCVQLCGGSAASTVAGLAALGATVGYIGKVRDDALGDAFRHDLAVLGVHYVTGSELAGPPTAHCLIFVTPDAQRTMNTYLGACASLTSRDIDRDVIEASYILYLEGYLFDRPHAQDAFREAARLAHAAGRRVALSLSDAFCVARHREAFMDLLEHHIDILFANEAEIKTLLGIDEISDAVAWLGGKVAFAAVTRGSLGSIIIDRRRTIAIPAAPLSKVVDTTGAGDLYAAGVLFGLASHRSPEECGWIGSLVAAEAISHYGGRPTYPLKDYLAARWNEMPIAVRHAQIQRSR